jgi:hypothetical protein
MPPSSNPSFDIKQPSSEMDQILSDGMPHRISVLFADKYRFRVMKGQGTVVADNGWGLTALSDSDGALASVASILKQYPLATLAPIYAVDPAPTEQELDQRQRDLATRTGRNDLPNDGSWATMTLRNFSASTAKSFALSLQALTCVRSADIVPSTGSVGSQ